jgi:hypothetical protein
LSSIHDQIESLRKRWEKWYCGVDVTQLRRRGMQVNHKRLVRIMQEDNLLALQPKRFI